MIAPHPGSVLALAPYAHLESPACRHARRIVRQRPGESVEAAVLRVVGMPWYGERPTVMACYLWSAFGVSES